MALDIRALSRPVLLEPCTKLGWTTTVRKDITFGILEIGGDQLTNEACHARCPLVIEFRRGDGRIRLEELPWAIRVLEDLMRGWR